jgi:anti-anti-sigma regulatory factor
VLKIIGGLSIGAAGALHKALDGYLGRGSDLVLDLSAVHECDTAALQLIYSLRRTASQRKQRFDIAVVSPEIQNIATALGLAIGELTSADCPGSADADSGSRSIDRGI